ncbi:hypothetical protein [Acetobacter syzygii]|uniref:hypothetical protein n=1 Tax=Acetobacter syzygii TaxID=146476 RepID=UPI00156E505D|nr:hypothetical protein [Acetobacter syzygii]NSL93880.1 hypothetical protein [Acetobacter syzygii]
MSDKPTGVFVRLPLSEEAQELLIDAAAFGKPDDSHDKAILAIGTPMTGGDASIVDYSEYEPEYHDQGMGCGLEDRGIHDRYEAMAYGWEQAMERACSEFPETVLLSDHQAQIEALEAEVVRLREALEESRNAIMSDLNARSIVCTVWAAPAETLVDYIDAALKGGAA